jgi:hypothetical protein
LLNCVSFTVLHTSTKYVASNISSYHGLNRFVGNIYTYIIAYYELSVCFVIAETKLLFIVPQTKLTFLNTFRSTKWEVRNYNKLTNPTKQALLYLHISPYLPYWPTTHKRTYYVAHTVFIYSLYSFS